jgi:hypothetical protein
VPAGLLTTNITQPDHSVVRLCWHAASDPNQHANSEVRERHPHLGDDRGGWIVAGMRQSGNDDIMAVDTAK